MTHDKLATANPRALRRRRHRPKVLKISITWSWPVKLVRFECEFLGTFLGRVDGFDQDESGRDCDDGSKVPGTLLTTQGDAFEAL